jgi:hypothetical protein
VRYWPGNELVVAGLNTKVERVTLLGTGSQCAFTQTNGTVTVTGLPDTPPDAICPVLRLDCAEIPRMYLTGGMRVPNVSHPPYDPCQSEIMR